LLVITYDEHGGLFDHVKPPATVNPGDKPPGSTIFNFERLGVRVPAVLVSPYIPPGTIINRVFDHTSFIATARKVFLGNSSAVFLTERDRQANTFEDFLTLPTPRTDTVKIPQPSNSILPHLNAAANTAGSASGSAVTAGFSTETTDPAEAAQRPLNEFQRTMVQQAFTAETLGPIKAQKKIMVSAIQTEQDAAEYLAAINEKIRNTRNKK
jgi:phospholipase C